MRFWPLILAVCSLPGLAPAQPVFTRIAMVGGPVTGGAAGTTLISARDAVIGPAGHVVFRGSISGIGGDAVLLGQPSTPPRILVPPHAAAPGTPAGVTFSTIDGFQVDSAGRVLIAATITGPGITSGVNDKGLWLHDGSTLASVLRVGDAPPGLSAGVTVALITSGVAFSNGRMSVLVTLAGTGVTTANDRALLFRDSNGTFSIVAREGSASLVAGTQWTSGFLGPRLNAAGAVLFVGTVNNGNTATSMLLAAGQPGALVIAARGGDAAPGAGAGVTFVNNFSLEFNFNDAGETWFTATLTGTGITLDDSAVLYKSVGGVPTLIAREGDAVGTGPLAPRMGQALPVSAGGGGIGGCRSILTGTLVSTANDTAILRRIGTVQQTILREGSSAPGEGSGVIFADPAGSDTYLPLFSINGAGQMLIEAGIRGGGLSAAEGAAFFGNDPTAPQPNTAQTFKLFRRGDTVFIAGEPGLTSATVTSAVLAEHGGTQEGAATSISDSGLAVFQLGLTAAGTGQARSGIFTISLAPPVAQASGACCDGAICSLAPSSACTGTGKHFAGSSTTCNTPGNLAAPCCFGDFNQSGAVSVQDVFDFLTAFFANDLRSDINGSGTVTVQDVFDYLGAFFAGCG